MDRNITVLVFFTAGAGFVWGALFGILLYKELQRRIEKRNKKTGGEAGKQ